MKTKPVAAVYDRRKQKNAPALIERRYRANWSVVAAVCDRRRETNPALIERHYNNGCNFYE